jgi:polysaccharide pyruvyl transferase WcaK-like protein
MPLPTGDRIVVGVSPMNYQHPDFYPAADPARYEQHVAGIQRICERLLERGIDVLLFTTDASDDVGLADVARRLPQPTASDTGRWDIAGARTVDELMAMYGSVHAVVASRLHGALLAHVAHRPVLALAHERKVRRLMTDVGHERFCFDLGHVDDAELARRLDEFIDRRAELSSESAESADRQRALVDAQYDSLFGARRD